EWINPADIPLVESNVLLGMFLGRITRWTRVIIPFLRHSPRHLPEENLVSDRFMKYKSSPVSSTD
ncbi:MAG: hypothetical protein ABJI92_21455, partial [Kangiellaceae bacterium]